MKDDNDKKHIKVTLVWGGTGESKPGNPELSDTAGTVFDQIYQRFHQKPSEQDTFEVNDKDFPRSQFGTTIRQLVETFGDELVFEIIPPTSGVQYGAEAHMALSEMARLALEVHLPLLRDGEYARRYGWQVDMDWKTGFCYVRLTCQYSTAEKKEETHVYMLRLSFDYYDAEQPGAIFVNPETREVGSAEDFQRWWPNVDGNPWINVQIQQSPERSYLCFQWTQEFKQTHAPVDAGDPKKWDPKNHNVVGVVRAVQRALDSPYYKGYRQK